MKTFDCLTVKNNKYVNIWMSMRPLKLMKYHQSATTMMNLSWKHGTICQQGNHNVNSELTDPITKAFCDWTKEIENLISERSSKESVCFN